MGYNVAMQVPLDIKRGKICVCILFKTGASELRNEKICAKNVDVRVR